VDDPGRAGGARRPRAEARARPAAAAEWRDAGDEGGPAAQRSDRPRRRRDPRHAGSSRSPLRLAVWNRNGDAAAGAARGCGGRRRGVAGGAPDRGGSLLTQWAARRLSTAAPHRPTRRPPPTRAPCLSCAGSPPWTGWGGPPRGATPDALRWKQQPAHVVAAAAQKGPRSPRGKRGRRRLRAGGPAARLQWAAAPLLTQGPPLPLRPRQPAPPALCRPGSNRSAPSSSISVGRSTRRLGRLQSTQAPASQRSSRAGPSRARGRTASRRPRAARGVMAARARPRLTTAHPVASLTLFDAATQTRQLVIATPGVAPSGSGRAASAAPDGRVLSGQASPLRRAHAAAAAHAPAALSTDDVITVLSPLAAGSSSSRGAGEAAYVPDVFIIRQQQQLGQQQAPPPPQAWAAATASAQRASFPRSRGRARGAGPAALSGSAVAALATTSGSTVFASFASDRPSAGGVEILSTVPGGLRASGQVPTPLHRVLAAAAAAESVTFQRRAPRRQRRPPRRAPSLSPRLMPVCPTDSPSVA